ncbi:MAG: MFS transporter [Chloroflexota bacterium]
MEQWRKNLRVIWFATFVSLVGGNLAMPFLPLFIHQDLGVSDPREAAVWSGLATAGSGIAMAIMAPIWGALADRHGRKQMLVRAQFAMGLANAISATTAVPWQFVVVRGIQGGFSGVVGASRALVASSVPRDRVPYAMGFIQSAIFMGQTLGPTIGGIVGSVAGFRTALFGTAVVNSIAGTAAILFIKEERTGSGGSGRDAPRGRAWDLLRSAAFVALLVLMFLSTGSSSCIRPILPLLLHDLDPRGDAATTAGFAFSILGIAGAAASFASSRYAASVGLKRMVLGAALGAALGNALISQAHAVVVVLGSLVLVGFCQGMLAASANALLSLNAPSSRQGTAFGILASAQAISMGAGPLLGGLVASSYGFSASFEVSTVMLVACALLGSRLRERRTDEPLAYDSRDAERPRHT